MFGEPWVDHFTKAFGGIFAFHGPTIPLRHGVLWCLKTPGIDRRRYPYVSLTGAASTAPRCIRWAITHLGRRSSVTTGISRCMSIAKIPTPKKARTIVIRCLLRDGAKTTRRSEERGEGKEGVSTGRYRG